MLTRRENLLIRPWQERRYIQHRLKVKSALPAIDTTSPPIREHVSRKLKKYQKESERCAQIISDNFTLLQHLSTIMTTTRVDHFWDDPPPIFVQRVGLYASGTPKRVGSRVEGLLSDEETSRPKTRKEKCVACSPEANLRNSVVFDERRPYTPPKKKLSTRSDTPIDWHSQFKSRCDEDKIEFRGNQWVKPPNQKSAPPPCHPIRVKGHSLPQKGRKKKDGKIDETSTSKSSAAELRPRKSSNNNDEGSLILSQGDLIVTVNFPSRTGVIYRSTTNGSQRILKQTSCECNSFRKAKKVNQ